MESSRNRTATGALSSAVACSQAQDSIIVRWPHCDFRSRSKRYSVERREASRSAQRYNVIILRSVINFGCTGHADAVHALDFHRGDMIMVAGGHKVGVVQDTLKQVRKLQCLLLIVVTVRHYAC